jgi:hypothetical protein
MRQSGLQPSDPSSKCKKIESNVVQRLQDSAPTFSFLKLYFQLIKMVSKGLAGAAALAMALASAGAFAPGAAFVKSPLTQVS